MAASREDIFAESAGNLQRHDPGDANRLTFISQSANLTNVQ